MKWRIILGLLVSSVFVVLAVRDIDWPHLWQTIKLTRWSYLVPSMLATIAGHYFRAWRWKFILAPVKNVRLANLFSATIIGLAANNILPARLGEIVRAHVIGQGEGISRTASFATIVFERIVDVFVLLVLLWVMLLKMSGPEWVRAAGIWILVLNVGLLAFMVVLERNPRPVVRIAAAIARPLPHSAQAAIDRWAVGFIAGLASISRPSTLLPVAVTSALVWGAALYSIISCLQAVNVEVSLLGSVALIVFVSLGSMIPSAPAFVGTVQYACIVALGLFGIVRSDALAFSLVFHASQFVLVTLLGVYYLMRSHITLGEFSRGQR